MDSGCTGFDDTDISYQKKDFYKDQEIEKQNSFPYYDCGILKAF